MSVQLSQSSLMLLTSLYPLHGSTPSPHAITRTLHTNHTINTPQTHNASAQHRTNVPPHHTHYSITTQHTSLNHHTTSPGSRRSSAAANQKQLCIENNYDSGRSQLASDTEPCRYAGRVVVVEGVGGVWGDVWHGREAACSKYTNSTEKYFC